MVNIFFGSIIVYYKIVHVRYAGKMFVNEKNSSLQRGDLDCKHALEELLCGAIKNANHGNF